MFASRPHDPDTGLINMRARWYSPDIGRFLSPDPAGLVDGTNLYAYASNDPVDFFDPSGLGRTGTEGNVGLGQPHKFIQMEILKGITRALWETASSMFMQNPMLGPLGMKAMWDAGNELTAAVIAAWNSADDPVEQVQAVLNVFNPVARGVDSASFMMMALEDGDWEGVGYHGTNTLIAAIETVLLAEGAAKAMRAPAAVSESTPSAERKPRSCFVAGTAVWTEHGLVNIENVEAGEWVLCADPESETWLQCEVEERLNHDHDGELVTLSVGGATVTATGNHPFWVVDGTDLPLRPVATDAGVDALDVDHARWIEARDVRPGDVMLLTDGTHERVESVTSSRGSAAVYNLRVDGLATYAVSDAGVLVHNKAPAKEWSIRGRLRDAGPGTEYGLPGGKSKSGPFRYRAPEGYNPAERLPRGPNGGYLDRFGNEWNVGPYHGDPSLGFGFEWDVQLSPQGMRHWNRYGAGARGYVNVRPDGMLSH